MKIEFESIEEARAVLHCLVRTNARNSHGDLTNILDHCENFEKKILNLITKPVETTNEQPIYTLTKDQMSVLKCATTRKACCHGNSGDCFGHDVIEEIWDKFPEIK